MYVSKYNNTNTPSLVWDARTALDRRLAPMQWYQTTKYRHYTRTQYRSDVSMKQRETRREKQRYASPWPVVCSMTSGAIQHGVPANVFVRSLRSPDTHAHIMSINEWASVAHTHTHTHTQWLTFGHEPRWHT